MTIIALRWEVDHGSSEIAYLGQIIIGMVGNLDADPSTWWYKVDGVRVKWIAKGFGYVKSKGSAKRGVERAFRAWVECAGLQ